LYEDEKDAYLFGKKLYLTSSEYRILRFLSFHEGIPFNAESIMSYCFPSTFARKKSNAITHICHINAKTKKLTENTIISCKKNVGYYVIKK
jgi:DNA-binding response OmpR family regulator